jgi:hypothetical protein
MGTVLETVTRCWALWAQAIVTVRNGEWEYSRVIACQRDARHSGEHASANDWFEVWWRDAQ